MSSEWTVARIKDVADVFDGPHATPTKITQGPIFLSISSLTNGKLDLAKSAHISEVDFKKWTRRVTPRKDDVVFSYETRLGEAAIIPEGLRCCLGRRLGLMRLKTDALIPQYLLYYYLGAEFQEQIKVKTIHGSTVERLSLTEFPDFEIKYPSPEVQWKICALLGGVDALVQNYLLQNVALESLVKALFRSWFINFEPVHAKVAGAAPEALSAELAVLFPSELEVSDSGPIPKGWSSTTFGEAFEIKGGGTPSTKEAKFWDNGTHLWATPKDLSDLASAVIYRTGNRISPAGVQKISSKVLPVGTTLMSSRAPVGYLAIAKAPMSINQGFIAIPPTADVSSSFILNLLSQKMPEIKANAGGTTFAEISKSQFRPIKWVRPSSEVMKAFSRIADPVYSSVHANCLVLDALNGLRDHLLPRLISGKLRIDDAEALVAEITSGLGTEPA